MDELPSYLQFKQLENAEFAIYFADGISTPARLVEVSDLKTDKRREGFSLIFEVGLEAPVTQEIVKVEHPEMGTLELFLVPIGRTATAIEYEAIFNRFVSRE